MTRYTLDKARNCIEELDVRCRGMNSETAFEDMLESSAMRWLKKYSPDDCADVIMRKFKLIPLPDRKSMGRYLLQGPFAMDLSWANPDKYADYFLNIISALSEEDIHECAKATPLSTCANYWVVFPVNLSRLPPIVLQQDGKVTNAYPVNGNLQTIVSPEGVEEIRGLIHERAQEQEKSDRLHSSATLSHVAEQFALKPPEAVIV